MAGLFLAKRVLSHNYFLGASDSGRNSWPAHLFDQRVDRVAIVRVMYKSSPKVYCNAVNFCRVYSASNSVSALDDGVVDVLLVEYFGGRYACSACTDYDDIVNDGSCAVGQCHDY